MYLWSIMDQPGKVANPARDQLNRENKTGKINTSLSACSCLRIWSRETGSAVVPSRVSLLISILRLNLVLTYYGILPEFRGGVHLFI